MAARIYKPARTAMQSGKAKTKEWLLVYEPEVAREVEPLMGWTASSDMKSQLRLRFATQEEANKTALGFGDMWKAMRDCQANKAKREAAQAAAAAKKKK